MQVNFRTDNTFKEYEFELSGSEYEQNNNGGEIVTSSKKGLLYKLVIDPNYDFLLPVIKEGNKYVEVIMGPNRLETVIDSMTRNKDFISKTFDAYNLDSNYIMEKSLTIKLLKDAILARILFKQIEDPYKTVPSVSREISF